MKSLADTIWALDLPTDKTTGHFYGNFYDVEFAKYRERPISLLEIGVNQGGSMRLWREYFRNAEEIVGIDRSLAKVLQPVLLRMMGIRLHEADAYKLETAESVGIFDIIIDDGSHALTDQCAVLTLYLPRLKPGGVLIIEDVQHYHWFGDLISAVPPEFQFETVDLRHAKGRSDDMLFVVRK